MKQECLQAYFGVKKVFIFPMVWVCSWDFRLRIGSSYECEKSGSLKSLLIEVAKVKYPWGFYALNFHLPRYNYYKINLILRPIVGKVMLLSFLVLTRGSTQMNLVSLRHL